MVETERDPAPRGTQQIGTRRIGGPTGERRIGGWGFEGASFAPSDEMLAWLEERIGPPGEPFPRFEPATFTAPPSRPLPVLQSSTSHAPLDRLAHARGQGINDLLRVRSGTVGALPDAVVRPTDDAELEAVLLRASREGLRVIPWGGGTSVTGGVTVTRTGADDTSPVISLDLSRLSGLEDLDPVSGLATFGAGTAGPAIEAALAEHGFTLGHFPQSFELSTLGGWIVTRASGQESLGYGSIQDLVAGLELVAPAGRLELPALPASAAGPDLRQLVLGSEGRLGVVPRATVRVRRRPKLLRARGTLIPSWEAGLAAARVLARERVEGRLPLTLLRLSDGEETEVGLAVGLGGARWLRPLLRGYLGLRGVRDGWGCLMLTGSAGDGPEVDETLDRTAGILRRHGGVPLGERPGRTWLEDRFRHPYLRDALLDRGIATDTLETAAPWSRIEEVTRAVRRALEHANEPEGERTAVLCHVSHPYEDGASLYFTFFFRCPRDPAAALERWAALKRAATDALVDAGGTLSHHHGVGSVHAPWLDREIGADGVRLLSATASTLDPDGVLNPHVLLDPTDRLEA